MPQKLHLDLYETENVYFNLDFPVQLLQSIYFLAAIKTHTVHIPRSPVLNSPAKLGKWIPFILKLLLSRLLFFLYTVITDSDLPRDIYICSVHMLVFVCVLQVIVNYKNVSSCCFILLKMHQPYMDTSMRNKLVCPQDNVHMLTVGFTFEMRMIYLRNSISVFSLVSICMIKGLT